MKSLGVGLLLFLFGYLRLSAQWSATDVKAEFESVTVQADVETQSDFGIRILTSFRLIYIAQGNQTAFSERKNFRLQAMITDPSGSKKLVRPVLSEFSAQLKPVTGSDFSEKSFTVFIPYRLFTVQGKQNLNLSLSVLDESGQITYPGNVNRQIQVDIPVMQPFSNQKFLLSDMRVLPGAEVDKLKGIKVSALIQTSVPVRNIYHPNAESQSRPYFFLKITNASGEVIWTPENTPKSYNQASTTTFYRKLNESDNRLDFFVPFNRLNLQEGNKDIRITIEASDYLGKDYFRNLTSASCMIRMPKVYLAVIDVLNLKVKSGEYDVPGRSIPLVGLFFGNKSKAGHGRPDIHYTLFNGLDPVYYSEIEQDAFTISDRSANFRICDGENIEFYIRDFDSFSQDDPIGTYVLKIPMGEASVNTGPVSFESVELVEFHFKKTALPVLDFARLDVNTGRNYLGVSGVFATLAYKSPDANQQISVLPSLLSVDGKSQPLSRWFPVDHASDLTSIPNEYKYFIPSFLYKPKDKLSIQLTDQKTGFILKILESERLPAKPLEDVIFSHNSLRDTVFKGVAGYTLKLNRRVPELYLKELDKDKIKYTYDLKELSSGIALNKQLRILNNSTIFCDSSICSGVWFLPYYLLSQIMRDTTSRIELRCRADIPSVQQIAGQMRSEFQVRKYPLIRWPGARIFFNLRQFEKDYKYIVLKMSHDGREWELAKVLRKGRFDLDAPSADFFYTPQDVLQLNVYSENYFGRQTLIESFTLNTTGKLSAESKKQKSILKKLSIRIR